jgi:hypothetical protein
MLSLLESHARVFAAICLLLVSGVLILARWKGPDLNSASPPTQSQHDVRDSSLETELITITPTGFEPAEISRPQGRFMFAIDNRSGLDSVDLYLEREKGNRVDGSLKRKGRLAWRQVIDLPAGTYVLRAANDESWQCKITLTTR